MVPPAIPVRVCPYTVTVPAPPAMVSRAGADRATRSTTWLAPAERLSGTVPDGAGSATVSEETPAVRSTPRSRGVQIEAGRARATVEVHLPTHRLGQLHAEDGDRRGALRLGDHHCASGEGDDRCANGVGRPGRANQIRADVCGEDLHSAESAGYVQVGGDQGRPRNRRAGRRQRHCRHDGGLRQRWDRQAAAARARGEQYPGQQAREHAVDRSRTTPCGHVLDPTAAAGTSGTQGSSIRRSPPR